MLPLLLLLLLLLLLSAVDHNDEDDDEEAEEAEKPNRSTLNMLPDLSLVGEPTSLQPFVLLLLQRFGDDHHHAPEMIRDTP